LAHCFGDAKNERDKVLKKVEKPKGATGTGGVETRHRCNGLDIGAKP
jgi:hypothetical protein